MRRKPLSILKMAGAKPRLFKMVRFKDGKGISGTGHVIDGVVFSNGQTVVHWRNDLSSISVFNSLRDFEKIHIKLKYEGENEFTWVEGYKPAEEAAEVCDTVERHIMAMQTLKQKEKGAIISLLRSIKRRYDDDHSPETLPNGASPERNNDDDVTETK